MRFKKSKIPVVRCSKCEGPSSNENPQECTVHVLHGEIKSTTVPSCDLPTQCNLTPLESQSCEPKCTKCVISRIPVYQNAYECKVNGDTVRFIQHISVPKSCKKVCQHSDASKPEDDIELKSKAGEHSPCTLKMFVEVCEPPANDKVVIQKDIKPETKKHLTKSGIGVYKPICCKVDSNSDVEQTQVDKLKFKNKDRKHELKDREGVVIKKDKIPVTEKIYTKEPASSSVEVCKPKVCKICQNLFVEQSQLVDNDKPAAKAEGNFEEEDVKLLPPKESVITADQTHQLLIAKEKPRVKDKVTSNTCSCQKLDDNDQPLTEPKSDSAFDDKNEEREKRHRSTLMGSCYPCSAYQKLDVEKSDLIIDDVPPGKSEGDFESEREDKREKSDTKLGSCYPCKVCKHSKVEKSELIDNDRSEKKDGKPEKEKSQTRKSSSIGSCYPCQSSQNSNIDKSELIENDGKPEREKSQTRKSSSIGSCYPCKASQKSNIDKSELSDNDVPPAKSKSDFKSKKKDVEYPLVKVVSKSCVCQQSDGDKFQSVGNYKTPAKDKVVKQKEETPKREKSDTKIGSCYPCKVCKHSNVEKSELIDNDMTENKDVKLPKQSVVATDHNDKEGEPEREESETKKGSCYPCKVNKHSNLGKSELIDKDMTEKKDVKYTTQKQTVVATDQNKDKEGKPKKEKSETKKGSCYPCKVYKHSNVEKSEVIDKDISEKEDVKYTTPKQSVVATDQNKDKEGKPVREKSETKKGSCYPCKVSKHSNVEKSELIDKDVSEKIDVKCTTLKQSVVATDQNKAKVVKQKDRKPEKEKSQTRKSSSIGSCYPCKSSQNSNIDKSELIDNDVPPAKSKSDFKSKKKDVEHPLVKVVSKQCVCQQSDGDKFQSVGNYKTPAKDKVVKQKDKKPKKEKSLTKRPTFSSLGFLITPLKAGKTARLTKAEIAKYRKRKQQWDKASACALPKFGFYGAMDKKLYKYGERGSGFRAKSDVQDFYKLRDYHLSSGTLFEDPEFPPTDSSLFYSERPNRHYEWKRPGELVGNPRLFVDGYSRFDVQQGELGDCWLLAAAANLTLHRKLFFQVVPTDQSFDENYAGIFHFRFWQYGRWIDVVIDDRLPTYRDQLIFLHSTEENEFWSALLEKAYAKLHGSYEALKGGSTCEAMEDFTGGVTEMYELAKPPPDLFKIVLKGYERCSLMGCSLEPDPNVLEAETSEGLIRGHAYSITKVKYVDIQTPTVVGKIPLLRLRNPWGNDIEWSGPWSDKSAEWQFISDDEKEELGLTFDDDGEFWMSFKDFMKHFDRLEICNLTPDSLTEEELTEGHKKKWEISVFEGEWVRGVTAGGCRNFLNTFWMNPQYRITLTDPDDDDDDNKCTVIVALMQKNRRAQRRMGMDLLTVGFSIYYIPNPDRVPKPLDINFFNYNYSVGRSPNFVNLREVSCRFRLPPGTYCIVPSTFDPDEEGEFILRVFSEHKNNMEENDEEFQIVDVDEKTAKETPTIKKRVPTTQETEEGDKAKEFFLKLAGEDMEIDWMELKQILDYAMRSELPTDKISIKGVDATPPAYTSEQSSGNNLLTTLVSLVCGALCKDTPLAEIIPAPTEVPQATASYNNELSTSGFSKDICRSMVAMMDVDRSGKLGFAEFRELWVDIRNWKVVFKMYDKDNSGALSGAELRNAFKSAGYHLNNHILNILMHRYGSNKGVIEFDDFIMCAVKLKTIMRIFKDKDPDNTDAAVFSLEEWMENTVYT